MDIPGLSGGARRINGVVIGIVTENQHPEGLYRVKVKFPWIRDATDAQDSEDFLSTWCRIATPMAGLGRGVWCLPEVDDEVLIAFEHGDLRRPYVIGALWNGVDLPPVADKAPAASTDPMGVDLGIADACVDTSDAGANNRARFMHSRSGHLLLFDDAKDQSDEKIVLKTAHGHVVVLNDKGGSESIAIYDSTGEEYVYIDEANKKITIETKNGDIDILCKNGTLNVEATKIVTKASDTAEHEASNKMTHKSNEIVVNGSSKVDVDGGTIELN